MAIRSISVLLAGVALAAAPSVASAKPADVATTRALARAADALVVAAHPDIRKGLAAVRSFANGIAAQCPRAAAGSPQNHDSEQLDDEVIGAMTVVGYHTAAGPIAAFAHTVERLHWSDRRLTRAVRTLATKLKGLSTLAVPNLCGDIGGWAAGGFQTLLPSTVQFDRRYSAVDTEAEEVPLIIRLAMPYASPRDFSVLRRIERFEAQLGEAEAKAVEYYTRLMNALELNQ